MNLDERWWLDIEPTQPLKPHCNVDWCEAEPALNKRGHSRGFCLDHMPLAKTPSYPQGSVVPAGQGYMKIKVGREWVLQHRHVMEESLGRSLAPGENVHHINGDRADNRIENLELWFSPQPYGQRVDDLLRYAVEVHRERLIEMLDAN